MSSHDRLVDLLPTLWRPQPEDATLLSQWLRAVGAGFDTGASDLQHVLRAHWFDTADAAAWASHFAADRRERGLGALRLGDVGDQREAQRYPWIRDLARLGGLLDLPPWREPASLREGVEEYRQRVQDVLGACREGLVTPAALRRLVDAALPEDMAAEPAAQRRMYAVEEPVALRSASTPLVAPPTVQQGDRVAPLARWQLSTAAPGAADSAGAGGSGGAAPGFVIQGVAADAFGGPTAMPMVERHTPGAAVAGIGVAYTGTLAPGQALRLMPTRRHWLLRGADLLASAPETGSNTGRDPSANGPYAVQATLAEGTFTGFSGAPDGSLWLRAETDTAALVLRWDGTALTKVDTDLPAGPHHALLCAGDSAWLGTNAGLFRCRLWPADGVLRWQAVAAVSGAVRVLSTLAAADPSAADPDLIAAGAQGLWQLAADGTLRGQRHAALDVIAWAGDAAQQLFATERALYLARQGQVWRFDAQGPSESTPDWTADDASDATHASPLPAVTAIARTPDGSLWLGGPAGLARWFAGEDGTTRLTAFPDVCPGAVHTLAVDARGLLWIAGDDGLLRFDGRDLAQFDLAAARWRPLGDADRVYPDALRSEPRGVWRYDRTGAQWQRFDAGAQRFAASTLAPRGATADTIAGCAMRPALHVELGAWDGHAFTPDASAPDVPAAALRLRIKPDDTRCVDGAALPYLPPDVSGARWRYLQLAASPTPPAAGRPWWSTEGQLFPPPTARGAPVPGHRRDAASFLADAEGEGQFDHAAFTYPPSARLWVVQALAPAVGIRVRLFQPDPALPIDPALAERVWQLIARARPAGVPLQLMAEGRVLKESAP